MSSTAKARWARMVNVVRASSRFASAATSSSDREPMVSSQNLTKTAPIISTTDSRKRMPAPIAETPSREAAASEVEPASDFDIPTIDIIPESGPGTPVAVYSTVTREVSSSSDDNTTISSRDGDSITGSVERVRFKLVLFLGVIEPLDDFV